jgi:hypothetical protein
LIICSKLDTVTMPSSGLPDLVISIMVLSNWFTSYFLSLDLEGDLLRAFINPIKSQNQKFDTYIIHL